MTKRRPFRAGKTPAVGPFERVPVPAEHAATVQSMWADRLHVVIVTASTVADQPFRHLAVRRKDGAKISDHWVTLMRIKDLLLGTEAEAVEIYPARSRFVDAGNDYHLHCPVGQSLPFGMLPEKTP